VLLQCPEAKALGRLESGGLRFGGSGGLLPECALNKVEIGTGFEGGEATR
jgi:hypothetical protein